MPSLSPTVTEIVPAARRSHCLFLTVWGRFLQRRVKRAPAIRTAFPQPAARTAHPARTRQEDAAPAGLRLRSRGADAHAPRLLTTVGGASLLLAGLEVGQSIGGWTRRPALFAPRGLSVALAGTLPVSTAV